jgi:hypothetical protein
MEEVERTWKKLQRNSYDCKLSFSGKNEVVFYKEAKSNPDIRLYLKDDEKGWFWLPLVRPEKELKINPVYAEFNQGNGNVFPVDSKDREEMEQLEASNELSTSEERELSDLCCYITVMKDVFEEGMQKAVDKSSESQDKVRDIWYAHNKVKSIKGSLVKLLIYNSAINDFCSLGGESRSYRKMIKRASQLSAGWSIVSRLGDSYSKQLSKDAEYASAEKKHKFAFQIERAARLYSLVSRKAEKIVSNWDQAHEKGLSMAKGLGIYVPDLNIESATNGIVELLGFKGVIFWQNLKKR